VRRRRDDVVLAHLNHPLVSMSTRCCARRVQPCDGLSRVTAVVGDDPALEEVFVGAYARFVVVGADGLRLHEEVLHVGGWMPENGRFAAWRTWVRPGASSMQPSAGNSPCPCRVEADRTRWPQAGTPCCARSNGAPATRGVPARILQARLDDERKRLNAVLDQFGATLRSALARNADDDENALFGLAELDTAGERAQYRRDRENWDRRLKDLETQRELEMLASTPVTPLGPRTGSRSRSSWSFRETR